MIKLENISKQYGQDILFEDISLLINSGERCAFIGRNGSGKTTLFKIIAGKEESDTGTISVPKDYSFGVLEQHLIFDAPTILEEVISGLPEYHKDETYRAEKVLSGLGFKEDEMHKSHDHFSGGYQLRVKLAKVLISEPNCLLLDEPTNYLDLVAIKWLKRFLSNWPNELIIISHDRDFLNAVCNTTIGIHRHKITKINGNTAEYYEYLCQEEEIYEKTRQNLDKKRAHLEDFVNRFGAKASKASQSQSKLKAIEKIPALKRLSQIYNLNFTFNHYPSATRSFIKADKICFSYPNMKDIPEGRHLIENLSIEIENGDRLAIIGKNGRGKSTLLKLLANEHQPQTGNIKFAENLKIGYFGQMNIERLDLENSVENEIALANPDISYGAVRKICGTVMFSGDRAKKKISVLSGGERSRVLLGKILAQECNLLLLDEPTNHLDIESIEALVNALEAFPGTVIIVSHSEEILERIPQSFVICHEYSQKHFLGDYEDLLKKWDWDDQPKKPKKVKKKQESRTLRAEVVQSQSKKLKPLKDKIKALEEVILKKEEALSLLNKELLLACKNKNGKVIQSLSQKTSILKIEIEESFDKLEKYNQELNALQ